MLLRVLQEQEFERVGGTQTIHVDVRIVAATNRHLEQAVEDGGFREDLFYRLNVFPLNIPPLRERKDDLNDLLSFFVGKYQHLTGSDPTFEEGLVDALKDCDWPGNVREFEKYGAARARHLRWLNFEDRAFLLRFQSDESQEHQAES